MAYTNTDPQKQRRWLIKKGWYPSSGWIQKRLVTIWTKNLFNRGGRRRWICDQESAVYIQNKIDNREKRLLEHVK